MKFVFFGSSPISLFTLDALEAKGFLPSLVVTQPDKPKGRGLELAKSPVKDWAEKRNIEVLTFESLQDPEFILKIRNYNLEIGILVSYGKIIPQNIIDIFPKGILNMHPSLLPLLRGPSPIEFSILEDMKETLGVSVMLLEKGMDTGPILAQKHLQTEFWPVSKEVLHDFLGQEGATLLADNLQGYRNGNITPKPQEHKKATYSRIIKKEDGLLNLEDDAYKNFLKYNAFKGWPGTYFFIPQGEKSIRIKITEAAYEDNLFILKKVIPEGKKEMDFESFKRGLKL